MAEGTEISIDTKIANTLASQLANENLQLRQQLIRAEIEKDELQQQLTLLEAEKDEPEQKTSPRKK